MVTSGNKFYVNNVTDIDNDKCFREAIKSFPEGIEDCVKHLIFDTEDDAPEKEEMLAYIDGQSIAGIKISLLKTGQTTVFIGWNAGGIDILLGFEYLKALDKNVINYTKAGAAPFTAAGLGECAVAIGHSDNAYQAYDQGYPIVISFPKEGAGYGVGCAAMVKGGPADEQEAAHKFIEWLVSVPAMEIANEYDMYPLNMNSVTDPKMVPFDEIVRVKIDTRLSAETKADNCARFEAEVRSTADIIK